MERKFNLHAYAVFSAAFLFSNQQINGEVIYTDIDPDIYIDETDEFILVDIDNNGTPDFSFAKQFAQFLTITYYGSPGGMYTASFINGGCDDAHLNAIKGSYDTCSSECYRIYPFAYEEGDLIKNLNDLFEDSGQRLAFRVWFNGIYAGYAGNWSPDVSDHYLGIRFVDLDEKFHYGWIRCTVADTNQILIIKDYAYETVPETKIIAGDTIGTITSIATPEDNLLNANIYTIGQNIFIIIQDYREYVSASIFSSSGELIYSDLITSPNSEIELDIPHGIYFIELNLSDQKYLKEIVL
jgi:hypothetical protein